MHALEISSCTVSVTNKNWFLLNPILQFDWRITLDTFEIEIDLLHCRFWLDGEKPEVCKYVCPVNTMPHFEFASCILAGIPDSGRYGKYIDYSTKFYNQNEEERHSRDRFSRSIESWQSGFEDFKNPIIVGTRNGIHFIIDGTHRTSFALASGRSRIMSKLSSQDEEWEWRLDVERIASLEDILPVHKWVIRS